MMGYCPSHGSLVDSTLMAVLQYVHDGACATNKLYGSAAAQMSLQNAGAGWAAYLPPRNPESLRSTPP